MRTYQHIIDTMAVKQVLNSIPENIVVRELTERDYGIDLMVEFFDEQGIDKYGHKLYDSTGYVCYLQIKGTDSLLSSRKNKISFSIDIKSLLYVERFSTPFILTRVCTLKGKECIYFVWLQRYISDVLDMNQADWRNTKKKTLTIYIPVQNDFKNNFAKVERISYRIKFIEELAEFVEKYSFISMQYDLIIQMQNNFDFTDMIRDLLRLSKLNTLLTKNDCCVDKDVIIELILYLEKIATGEENPLTLEDFPHNHNLDLLMKSIMNTMFVEEMVAENEFDTTY